MAVDLSHLLAQTIRPGATFAVPLHSARPSRQTCHQQSRWLTFFCVHGHWLLLLLLISVLGGLALEISDSVSKLVEKAIEKHAADGLARVDYAAASWGATVVGHSEPRLEGDWTWLGWWSTGWNGVHQNAIKMLSPSFGEPGRCFPLKGSSGFVVIKLREPIVPEAITLEHVSNRVVDDRSDAPKECRVSAWLQHDRYDNRNNEFVLAEFSYDLGKSNVQTFDVSKSVASEGDEGIVNMVRLEFLSNHGSPDSTCMYRLRVHGRKRPLESISNRLPILT